MSLPEYPPDTEAQQILAEVRKTNERLDTHAEAINGLGANVQWIIDNVKGLFQMMGDPRFMNMLPQMMNPAGMAMAAKQIEGVTSDGSAIAEPAGSAAAGPAAGE